MLLRRHIILILLTLEEGSPALIIMTDSKELRNILRNIKEKLDEKKSKSKSRYVFKSKGNKIQADFLEDIMAQLSDLKTQIKSGSQTRSKNLVKDVIKKNYRNRLNSNKHLYLQGCHSALFSILS